MKTLTLAVANGRVTSNDLRGGAFTIADGFLAVASVGRPIEAVDLAERGPFTLFPNVFTMPGGGRCLSTGMAKVS